LSVPYLYDVEAATTAVSAAAAVSATTAVAATTAVTTTSTAASAQAVVPTSSKGAAYPLSQLVMADLALQLFWLLEVSGWVFVVWLEASSPSI